MRVRLMIAFGDIAERALRAAGITKERVQIATGMQDCGCDKRQQAMNEFGYRWQRWFLIVPLWLRYKAELLASSRRAKRIKAAWQHIQAAWRILFSAAS